MRILITGGAGFIGFHSARHFSSLGNKITILDDLSRPGASFNLQLLLEGSPNIDFIKCDVSIREELFESLGSFTFDVVLHLAAQTAVTTSLVNPSNDFNSNALGSLNILEWARAQKKVPFIVYSSTNKVYGDLYGANLVENESRYSYITEGNQSLGINEEQQLSFKSPYGCSKGYADQAFLDYFESFNVPTVVFRQSCIYGTFQYGVEDQGWVAWMALATLGKKEISIYGNGKQVRDLLFVDDLVQAYEKAINNQTQVQGKAFNIGGGYTNSMSIVEYLDFISDHLKTQIDYSFHPPRLGDQKYFVSDNAKITEVMGWKPNTRATDGIPQMIDWISKNRIHT